MKSFLIFCILVLFSLSSARRNTHFKKNFGIDEDANGDSLLGRTGCVSYHLEVGEIVNLPDIFDHNAATTSIAMECSQCNEMDDCFKHQTKSLGGDGRVRGEKFMWKDHIRSRFTKVRCEIINTDARAEQRLAEFIIPIDNFSDSREDSTEQEVSNNHIEMLYTAKKKSCRETFNDENPIPGTSTDRPETPPPPELQPLAPVRMNHTNGGVERDKFLVERDVGISGPISSEEVPESHT